MRAVDEGTNGLHGDVERDDDHRERDPSLRPAFESFCRDGIVPLGPEAPHEHDRRGRVEQRSQGEPGQRQAAVDERDDESSDADGAVPRDREVREPERGYDEFGAVADRPQTRSVGGRERLDQAAVWKSSTRTISLRRSSSTQTFASTKLTT